MDNSNTTIPSIVDTQIGTDPTTIEVIESLDLTDEKKDDNKGSMPGEKKPKKPKDTLKLIVFTIVILALMGGVSYGIYFYLSLGNKKPVEDKFVILPKTFYTGEALPESISEYGNFSKLDISSCHLDVSNVDINTPGEYEYSITCDGAKYSSKILIMDKIRHKVTTNLVYKFLSDSYNINDFITTKTNYVFSFVNEDLLKTNLKKSGGPYTVELLITDENAYESYASSIMYVINEKPSIYFTCEKTQDDIKIVDRLLFDDDKNLIDITSRAYTFTYEDEKQYYELIETIIDNTLTINDITGSVLRNDDKLQITLLNHIDRDTLKEEMNKKVLGNYNDISKYYEENTDYKCSL